MTFNISKEIKNIVIGVSAVVAVCGLISIVLLISDDPTSNIIGIFGIGSTMILVIIVYNIDQARKNSKEDIHKKIIKSKIKELHEIIVFIILEINDRETDQNVMNNRLHKYFLKNYSIMDTLVNDIKLHNMQCSALSDDDQKTINYVLSSIKNITDKYRRPDIPEDQRIQLWTVSHNMLRDNAAIIANATKTFQE